MSLSPDEGSCRNVCRDFLTSSLTMFARLLISLDQVKNGERLKQFSDVPTPEKLLFSKKVSVATDTFDESPGSGRDEPARKKQLS
jgi:hypothetical protein